MVIRAITALVPFLAGPSPSLMLSIFGWRRDRPGGPVQTGPRRFEVLDRLRPPLGRRSSQSVTVARRRYNAPSGARCDSDKG
jgi:hypothetical protein